MQSKLKQWGHLQRILDKINEDNNISVRIQIVRRHWNPLILFPVRIIDLMQSKQSLDSALLAL